MQFWLHNNYHLLLIIGSVLAVGICVMVWRTFLDDDRLAKRLKNVATRRDELRAEMLKRNSEKKKTFTQKKIIQKSDLFKSFQEWLKKSQGEALQETRIKLMQAGFRSRDAVGLFYLLRFTLPFVFGALGFLLFYVRDMGDMSENRKLLANIGMFALGFFGPAIYIKNQIQKRQEVLGKYMADAFDLLVICAEAGLSLDAALDRVSREIGGASPMLAEEIGLTSVELGFLPERSMALRGLAERVPLQGVQALASTLIQTEKYGTPLAQALRVLSAEMRDERIMKAEEKAAKLPAILTVPMILFILPPLFIVLLGPAILKAMDSFARMGN